MELDYVDTNVAADEIAEYLHIFSMYDREEMTTTHEDIAATFDLIGGSVRKYRRERRTQAREIVSELCEIHSGSRVTGMARRKIINQNWNSEGLAKVRVSLWQIHASLSPEVVFPKDRPDDQRVRPDAAVVPRYVYIKLSDFEQYGYTAGCARCEHALKHGN